jgi:hypothetical protein
VSDVPSTSSSSKLPSSTMKRLSKTSSKVIGQRRTSA